MRFHFFVFWAVDRMINMSVNYVIRRICKWHFTYKNSFYASKKRELKSNIAICSQEMFVPIKCSQKKQDQCHQMATSWTSCENHPPTVYKHQLGEAGDGVLGHVGVPNFWTHFFCSVGPWWLWHPFCWGRNSSPWTAWWRSASAPSRWYRSALERVLPPLGETREMDKHIEKIKN